MLFDQLMSGSSPIMVTPVVTKSHRPSVFEMNFNLARFQKQPLTPLIDESSIENLRLSHQISWSENLFNATPSNTIDNTNMTPSISNATSIAPIANCSISNARSLYNILDHYYKKSINIFLFYYHF